jgi:ribosome maturation factor RimP
MTTAINTEAPSIDERIRVLLDGVVADTSVFLVDIVVRGRKGSRVVEVYVDSDEQLAVEELARISRELGFLLDGEDFIRGGYRLNVSTPGVERPLVLARQFPRNVGRMFQIRYLTDQGVEEVQEGELVSADGDQFVFRLRGGTECPVDFPSIQEAKVLLPW